MREAVLIPALVSRPPPPRPAQTKSFGDTAAGTFDEEEAATAAARKQAMAAIPGMVGPNELPDDGMADS
jgi:hypothetical protein